VIKESVIRDLNPWWKDKDRINDDHEIQKWENSMIKYDPRLRHKIVYDFEPDNSVVYTLRGPRQVGKTTLVKLQIREFLKSGISPWNILYYSLELSDTKQDVVDVVETYMKISRRQRGANRSYIFLDEASSVPDWQKGIKWLVDQNILQNCTVMVTGSQAINIQNATERLPGRKGRIDDNYDKILLPMKFAEYVSLHNKDIRRAINISLLSSDTRKKILTQLFNLQINSLVDKIHAYLNELNDLFHDYMITGGIPKIVDEKLKCNTIKQYLYHEYLDTITGQWSALSKNEILLKQFCGAIIKCLSSHTSWSGLSKESALGSPNTAQDYALTLKDLFVLTIIHAYGDRMKIPLIHKDRKFYFHDPFFLHIFNGLLSASESYDQSIKYLEDEKNQSHVVECVIADHLIRLAFSLSKKKQSFDYFNHIFYWKDEKNREVDFVLYDGDTIEVPIEVKYRNSINSKELSGLVSFITQTGRKSGIVVSKNDLEIKNDYVIIPASVFLMLI
jgi:predicted AAA+ superfamily ATPase